MSDYQPKHRDMVTVACADGEWKVHACNVNGTVGVLQNGMYLTVLPSMLTKVPTPPPEPAMGEGVFVDGWLHLHDALGWRSITKCRKWSDIAADFDRAVPEKAHRKQVIDEVVEWLRKGTAKYVQAAATIEREFGGGNDE